MLYAISTKEFIDYIQRYHPRLMDPSGPLLTADGIVSQIKDYEKGLHAIATDLRRNKWYCNGATALTVAAFEAACPRREARWMIEHYSQLINGVIAESYGRRVSEALTVSGHIAIKSGRETMIETEHAHTWVITYYPEIILRIESEKQNELPPALFARKNKKDEIKIPGTVFSRSKITEAGVHVEWIYTSNALLHALLSDQQELTPEVFLQYLEAAEIEEAKPPLTSEGLQTELLSLIAHLRSRGEGGFEKAQKLSTIEYLVRGTQDPRMLEILSLAALLITRTHRETGLWGLAKANFMREPTSYIQLKTFLDQHRAQYSHPPSQAIDVKTSAWKRKVAIEGEDEPEARQALHDAITASLASAPPPLKTRQGLQVALSLLECPLSGSERTALTWAIQYLAPGLTLPLTEEPRSAPGF